MPATIKYTEDEREFFRQNASNVITIVQQQIRRQLSDDEKHYVLRTIRNIDNNLDERTRHITFLRVQIDMYTHLNAAEWFINSIRQRLEQFLNE